MTAQGSQAGISYAEETVWGTTPTEQFTGVNFTSEDMAFNIENQVSNNIRSDRQTGDLVQVGASTEGGFETEFQAGNIDGLLPGFFWDTDWHTIATVTGNTSFAIETGAGVGGIITFDGGYSVTVVVGNYITIAGASNSANNGTFLVLDVTGQDVQVDTPLVTEATVAGVTMKGDYLRNGVTKHSYSIERANNDVSQFFLYKGMVGNSLEMTIESGSPLMAKLSFVGKNETLAQVTNSDGAATTPPITPIFNAVSSVGQVGIDNTALSSCLLQKVSFNLDNQVEGKTGVGVLGYCDADAKSIALSGDISLYFNDQTYYDKYLNSTQFSLYFIITDTDGSTYTLQLPACKFDEITASVTGKDDDVLLEGSFVAIVGTNDYTIQMTRALA